MSTEGRRISREMSQLLGLLKSQGGPPGASIRKVTFSRFRLGVRVWWAWLRVRHWFIAPFLRRECLRHPYWESRDVIRKGKGTGPMVRKWADDSRPSTSDAYVRPTLETVYFSKPPV